MSLMFHFWNHCCKTSSTDCRFDALLEPFPTINYNYCYITIYYHIVSSYISTVGCDLERKRVARYHPFWVAYPYSWARLEFLFLGKNDYQGWEKELTFLGVDKPETPDSGGNKKLEQRCNIQKPEVTTAMYNDFEPPRLFHQCLQKLRSQPKGHAFPHSCHRYWPCSSKAVCSRSCRCCVCTLWCSDAPLSCNWNMTFFDVSIHKNKNDAIPKLSCRL